MTRPIAGAIVGALLLISGSTEGVAQTLAASAKPGASNPAGTAPAARKPAKPATTAAKPVAARTYDGNEPGRLSDYWTIERALPGRPSERVTRASQADTTPGVSRVPMQNAPGTMGVAAGNIRSSEFYDGRPVPGITQNSYNNSSYVGMSITMPSGNNSFPIPAPPFGSSAGW